MPTLIAIGGPSRVGKTLATNKIAKVVPRSTIFHLDPLTESLRIRCGIGADVTDEDRKDPVAFADKCHARDAIVCGIATDITIDYLADGRHGTTFVTDGNWWPDLIDEERLAEHGIKVIPVWMYRLADSAEEAGRALLRTDGMTDEEIAVRGRANLEKARRYAEAGRDAGSAGDGAKGFFDTGKWPDLDRCLRDVEWHVVIEMSRNEAQARHRKAPEEK